VTCTGKEDRLLDCDFPENFGVDYEPASAPVATAPPPSSGLANSGCSSGTTPDNARLAVICRNFEITGTLSPASSPWDNTVYMALTCTLTCSTKRLVLVMCFHAYLLTDCFTTHAKTSSVGQNLLC